MSMLDIDGDYVLPIISGTPSAGNIMKVGRFLGTGFFVNSEAGFATCKHVTVAIKENQRLYEGQLKSPSVGDYLRIKDVRNHDKYDIAIGTVETGRKTNFLKPYNGVFALGVDVGAFGYTDAGKENDVLGVDTRYLKGHISRLAEEAFALCELSFAVPSGFSGTAILSETYELVGMAYGNAESIILSYSLTDVVDSNSTFLENVYRVMEFGLCHTVNNLKSILPIWEYATLNITNHRVVLFCFPHTPNPVILKEQEMNSSKPSIDELWTRLKKYEGDNFATKTGMPFTYTILGDVFHSSRTDYNISKGEFQKALELVPFDGPGVINRIVRGPSYVWAVLHDKRIREKDW